MTFKQACLPLAFMGIFSVASMQAQSSTTDQAPGSTTTTTTTTGSAPAQTMTKADIKAQRKQQKHLERSQDATAKAAKLQAKARKSQDKAIQEQEKSAPPA